MPWPGGSTPRESSTTPPGGATCGPRWSCASCMRSPGSSAPPPISSPPCTWVWRGSAGAAAWPSPTAHSPPAAAAGLTAALAERVLAGGEVVAVVEFLVGEARESDEHALGLVQTIAAQLGWLVQRRRSEDALRDSEQRFRQLAETINEVFWLADPPCSEMLYVSPAYEEIFGRSCASLYRSPRSWADAVHPEDRERIRTF